MGNIFGNKNKIVPQVTDTLESNVRKKRKHTRTEIFRLWFFCCCYNNKVAPAAEAKISVASSAADCLSRKEENDHASTKNCIDQVNVIGKHKDPDPTFSCSCESLVSNNLLQLPADRPVLPAIGSCNNDFTMRTATMKFDALGKTKSLSYDFRLAGEEPANRPSSRMSVRNYCETTRVKKQPASSKDEIDKKLSEALERKSNKMKERCQKLIQRPVVTKEMLHRLETEKQRLLKERLDDKEKNLQARKNALKTIKEDMQRKKERRTKTIKENAMKQELQVCGTAKRSLEVSLKAVEKNKNELHTQQRQKVRAAKLKHLRARINKLDAAEERGRKFTEKVKDGRFSTSSPSSTLVKGLQRLSKERKKQTCILQETMNKVREQIDEPLGEIETYQQDHEDASCAGVLEDDYDAFWGAV